MTAFLFFPLQLSRRSADAKGKIMADNLATGGLFSAVPEHLAMRLFARAVPVRLGAEELLFSAGDPGHGCYRVEQGLLKFCMLSPAGAERILAILGPGAIFGELAVLDGRPRSASVTAIRESRLSFLSRAAFEAFADHHPELYKHLVSLLAGRLRDTDDIVAATAFLPLTGRVAHSLLELAAAFGESVGDGRIVIRYKI